MRELFRNCVVASCFRHYQSNAARRFADCSLSCAAGAAAPLELSAGCPKAFITRRIERSGSAIGTPFGVQTDIVLVHGGGPGVEEIAAQWADHNGVHQVVCKPDWDRHGRAAPFRRNEELLNLLPKGIIAFPGSGITENLVDRARTLGIPVCRCAA